MWRVVEWVRSKVLLHSPHHMPNSWAKLASHYGLMGRNCVLLHRADEFGKLNVRDVEGDDNRSSLKSHDCFDKGENIASRRLHRAGCIV